MTTLLMFKAILAGMTCNVSPVSPSYRIKVIHEKASSLAALEAVKMKCITCITKKHMVPIRENIYTHMILYVFARREQKTGDTCDTVIQHLINPLFT